MADSEQPSGAAGVPAPQTLGEILRKARIAQDLTVEQLAAELRIEARQLTALEENKLEKIGVPVFIKGYLRQYGQRLGVDPRDLMALYYQQTNLAEVQIQPSRTIKLHDERQVTAWIVAALVLLVVVAGLAVWWLNGGTFDIRATIDSAVTTTTTPAPASVTAAPVRAPAAALPSPQSAPASLEPSVTTPATAAAAPPADTVPAASAAVAEAAEPAALGPSAGMTRLDITFEQESWAEVTDARGERLFYGLGVTGRRATVAGEPPFAIVLGNAPAVRLLVDGEPYPIPTQGRQGNLARFAVDIAEE